jgi:DNA ligase D-like protein (predicted ligase)
MASPLDVLGDEERGGLGNKKPGFAEPMLAKLSHEVFSDPEWIFERKLDGERIVAVVSGGRAQLYSRNRQSADANYPEVRVALAELSQAAELVVDGEVVAFKDGVSDFQALQPRMQSEDPEEARASGVSVYYYLFDIVVCDGKKLENLPLTARKRVLRAAFDFKDPIRFTAHRNEEGEKFHAEACDKGWEGVIGKKAQSKYAHGRSSHWLKLKCVRRQEFVIGGYTDPQGERIGFGALLVGYYQNGKLRYAGKIGTGYDDETLNSLSGRLESMERKTPPFEADTDLPSKGVHWVSPKLVCEAGFTQWTRDDKLRHPRYLGLRRDKNPKDVHREA